MSESTAKKEEKPRKFQAIKGTRDLLPPETALWSHVERIAQEVFASYGFGEIRLPVLEQIHLFERTLGLESDVVSKEMYEISNREADDDMVWAWHDVVVSGWEGPVDEPDALDQFEYALEQFLESLEMKLSEDESFGGWVSKSALSALWNKLDELHDARSKGASVQDLSALIETIRLEAATVREEDLALRPEATASVCRAYIEHNLQQLPQPVKLYYMGPMFRRERPQKGRYRQFYQIGAEVLGGSDAPAIDAEVIEMVMTFFERLDLEGVQLHVNSIGDKNCRPKYVEVLRAELRKVKDRLGPDSQRRIETNPLRVLDSKLESEQAIIEKLPRIAEHLCNACRENYDEVKRQLALRGIAYTQNFRLVRGLDYYMRTTFEITAKGLGSQNAVCGGGRYDGLVEMLGGPPTKGIGFAIGEDRLILSLLESGRGATPQGRDVYIAWMGENARVVAIRAAKRLRAAGFRVELPPVEQKFGKALGQADKLGARYALILGDNEVESGEWTLKTLANGEQHKIKETELIRHLQLAKKPTGKKPGHDEKPAL